MNLLLSVLVFLSVSFLTVFTHLNSPFNTSSRYKSLEIGFPFTYYEEFMVECPNLNFGWNLNNLILDIVLVFITVSGIMYFVNNKKTQ
uniref:hypothetical protein n=1 Tax=Flavobacterium sp. TaxID=239 RepID=UPI00404AA9D2